MDMVKQNTPPSNYRAISVAKAKTCKQLLTFQRSAGKRSAGNSANK